MHIHRRLRHRHSAAELAAAMGVSLRTVYRDIGRLRKEGYAVEGVSGPGGGFWLAEGCAPAPLSLGLDEVREVLFALHGAGSLDTDLEERLLGVLPAVHSTELRAALSMTKAPIALNTRTTRPERRQALAVFTRALARGQLASRHGPSPRRLESGPRAPPRSAALPCRAAAPSHHSPPDVQPETASTPNHLPVDSTAGEAMRDRAR